MTQHQINTVILKDEAGNFYLLSPELMARARATEEQQAELDARLGDADAAGFSYTFGPEGLIVVGLVYPNQLTGPVPLPPSATDVAEDFKPRR